MATMRDPNARWRWAECVIVGRRSDRPNAPSTILGHYIDEEMVRLLDPEGTSRRKVVTLDGNVLTAEQSAALELNKMSRKR